ncbi:MAG: metallophosphoesterase [Methanobacteriaceae archaeon]|jgi:serine/threonine-protein phosphatase PP1 catalytic subunit|nr:metallophosphoesterase [Candidatus Methanorudis spinitermitis]
MANKIGNKGQLLIFTDIHGDKELFDKYMDLWEVENPNCHICFAGDLIHGRFSPEKDKSPEILDIVSEYINYPNFHPLLGNHELSEIDSSSYLHMTMRKQRAHFIRSISTSKSKKELDDYRKKYFDLMCKFQFAIVTENGLWVSHIGPSKKSYHNVRDYLWNTFESDDNSTNVNDFLKNHDLKFMVVGHTETPKGYEFLDKQLIINSNHHIKGEVNNYYLDIDLSKIVDKELIKKSLKTIT